MTHQRTIDLSDWMFFCVISLLLGIGLLTIYSVTNDPSPKMPFYQKQIIWILLGWAFFLMSSSIDYHKIARFSYLIYALSIILLIIVAVAGRSVLGGRRWISFGFFSFQPSEFAKIGLLLALSRYCSDHPADRGLDFFGLLPLIGFFIVPFILILKQPDLGTGLALFAILISIIFVLGVRSRLLISFSLFFLMVLPFLAQMTWNRLKGYQRTRILTFLNPMADPTGSGWNMLQSKISIGSGGTWGKGVLAGTQSQLKFLPQNHTDFIFAVFSEAWGFAGVFVLFCLFLFLFGWGINVAHKAKEMLGILIGVGTIGLIAYHTLVNIGMTLGMLPVVGVPLPLVSYGGSSMITNMVLLGFLLNIKRKRFVLFY